MRVAVASQGPGGITAPISPHFGHCDAFTVVDIDEGTVKRVEVLPNCAHEQGNCLTPIELLRAAGAEILVVGGIGRRPLLALGGAGIRVGSCGEAELVSDAIELVRSGRMQAFRLDQTCREHAVGGCR